MRNEKVLMKINKRHVEKDNMKDIVISILLKISLFILLILLCIATYKAVLWKGDFTFFNKVEENIALIYVVGVIFLSLLLLLIFKCIDRFKIANKKIFVIGVFAIIIILQLIYASYTRIIPINDPGITHDEAMTMIEDNDISSEIHWNYFQRCTNNIPFTIFLGNTYKLCDFLGITDFIFIRNVIGLIFIDLSILFGYLLLKGIKGKNFAFKFLILCLINPLIYIEISYLYTNTISMTFIMGMLYFFYKIMKANSIKSKIAFTVIFSLITAIGGILRPTNYIVLIALTIYLILKLIKNPKHLKKIITLGIIFIIVLIATMQIYKIIEKRFVKFDYEDTATPWSHYVMMGFGETGRYSGDDVSFTRSFDTKEEKIRANLEEARDRIEKLNISGLLDLYSSKIQTVWSEGTSKYELTSSESETYSKVYKYVIGAKRDLIILYLQIYRIMILALALISTYKMIKNPKLNINYVSHLIILGAMLFFILWEANKTYAICFILLLTSLANNGLSIIENEYIEKISNNYKKIFSFIIIITVLLLISNYNHFTKKGEYIDKEVLINQTQCSVKYITRVYGDRVISQTFSADKPFNTIAIELKIRRNIKDVSYFCEILNNKGEMIEKIEIPTSEMIDGQKTIIKFDTINPNGKEEFTIKIYGDENTTYKKSINIGAYISENFDKVKNAELMDNGKKLGGDLQFSVYNEKNKAFFSKKVYIIIAVFIVLIEIITFSCYRKYNRNNCIKNNLEDNNIKTEK